MRRLVPTTIVLSLLVLTAASALAQEEEPPNPLDVVLDAFQTEGMAYTSRLEAEPTPGAGAIEDPVGDFEHSTGQTPGFTPEYLDIITTWALDLDTGPLDMFTPTNANDVWAATGRHRVQPPDHAPFYTFTGEMTHDGSQYDPGAVLFGFTLAATPPVDAAGRCEYVVWVNDLARGETFVNSPGNPGDPAGGTNIAFGLGLNPEGSGIQSTFTLEFQETGGFALDPETDVRAFITPGYVGLTVPTNQIDDLAGANFYTFCAGEGIGFEPQDTGADQTGVTALTFDDFGLMTIEGRVVPIESTTTTQPTTTTTAPTTTTTRVVEAQPAPEIPEPGETGFPWWFVLIGGGLALALIGWWLYAQDVDPCRRMLDEWKAAQEARDRAQIAAREAEDECDGAQLELESLEGERRNVCNTWPPACWSTEEGDFIEDQSGNRVTSRDVHMRKVALGDVWADYKAGKLTAGEVESRWRTMDTAEFRSEMRETDRAFKQLLEDVDSEISEISGRLERACRKAERARSAADRALERVDGARRAYERCLSETAHELGDEESHAPRSSAALPGMSAMAREVPDPCADADAKHKYEPAGEPHKMLVHVDFSIVTGVSAASERPVGEGRRLALDLNDLASDLDSAGDLLDARSAGLHIGGAINGYATGRYVATSAGVMKGGIDDAMAVGDDVAEPPTTPVGVGIEGLETLGRFGGLIEGKVADWMEGLQRMTVRLTMFYQDLTATPYTLWECREEVGWVCLEKVWEIEVSKLKRYPADGGREREFMVDSDVRRREVARYVRGLGNGAASRIRFDAEELAEWRSQHEPGPCE